MQQSENLQHWIRRLKSLAYACIILVFITVFIFELKRTYNIDLMPSFNSPLDDLYFKFKEVF